MNEWQYEVGLWFVDGDRWVVESDVDDGEDASCESEMLWRYDGEPVMEAIREDLFISMEYMREQWLICGMRLPEVEIVVRHDLGEVWRERWEW